MKSIKFWGVFVVVVVCAWRLGYLAGQERPRLFRVPNDLGATVFGWDRGNQCVALWSRTTNGLAWIRLE